MWKSRLYELIVHTGSIETQSFSKIGLCALQGVEGGEVALDDASSALEARELDWTGDEDITNIQRTESKSLSKDQSRDLGRRNEV